MSHRPAVVAASSARAKAPSTGSSNRSFRIDRLPAFKHLASFSGRFSEVSAPRFSLKHAFSCFVPDSIPGASTSELQYAAPLRLSSVDPGKLQPAVPFQDRAIPGASTSELPTAAPLRHSSVDPGKLQPTVPFQDRAIPGASTSEPLRHRHLGTLSPELPRIIAEPERRPPSNPPLGHELTFRGGGAGA
jgi:hypothetical protein